MKWTFNTIVTDPAPGLPPKGESMTLTLEIDEDNPETISLNLVDFPYGNVVSAARQFPLWAILKGIEDQSGKTESNLWKIYRESFKVLHIFHAIRTNHEETLASNTVTLDNMWLQME